jgi:hypothetical protein
MREETDLSRGIYHIDTEGRLVELRESVYASEDDLQQLLADHPALLAGDQRRWLLVKREAGIPGADQAADRWSVDHLFLDQNAIPTFVEVKRSTDTRIRREVVGQMLDYAANAVVYWPGERLKEDFEARCTLAGLDPGEHLVEQLGRDDPETFWQDAKNNLRSGNVRLVFVADVIPQELRRIVEFLNEQMDPAEVIALELRQFTGDQSTMRTLVPTVIGQTAQAQQRKGQTSPEKRQWTPERFYAALRETSGAAVDPARRLEEWATSRGLEIYWGYGTVFGSFIPMFVHNGLRYQFFAVRTNATLELQFGYLRTKPPFDSELKLRELASRLNEIPGIAIPGDRVNRFPNMALAVLAEPAVISAFLEIFDDVIEEVRRGVGSW